MASRSERSRRIVVLVALGALALGLGVWAVAHKKPTRAAAAHPIPVNAA